MKNSGAADERLIDFKIWIFGCRADQNNCPVFHMRKECILLRFVETMYFINKQYRAELMFCSNFFGSFNTFADISDSRQNGID